MKDTSGYQQHTHRLLKPSRAILLLKKWTVPVCFSTICPLRGSKTKKSAASHSPHPRKQAYRSHSQHITAQKTIFPVFHVQKHQKNGENATEKHRKWAVQSPFAKKYATMAQRVARKSKKIFGQFKKTSYLCNRFSRENDLLAQLV